MPDPHGPTPDTAHRATVLPTATSDRASLPDGLLLVDDNDQARDHSGKPVPPVTGDGQTYRWKVRLRGRNAYAVHADDLLALFIDNYPLPAAGSQWSHDTEVALVTARTQHCLGVMATHIGQALMDGELDQTQETLLMRAGEIHPDPITASDCPRWDHPNVTMLLVGDLYSPTLGWYEPPVGNVAFLYPGKADRYLASLAEIGLIALSENPACTAAPLVEVLGLDGQEPVDLD